MPIRIGVIGLGMGKAHARACLNLPGIELAAVAEPNPARLEDLAQLVNTDSGAKAAAHVRQIPVFADYQDMIRNAGLDGIIIALTTDLHFPATAYGLKHGVAVLRENRRPAPPARWPNSLSSRATSRATKP